MPLPGIEPWFFGCPASGLVTVPTMLSLINYSGMSLKVSVALSCFLRKVVLRTHRCPVVPQMCFKEIPQYCAFVFCTLNLCWMSLKNLTVWALCTTHLTLRFSLCHFLAYIIAAFLFVHVVCDLLFFYVCVILGLGCGGFTVLDW